MREEDFLQHVLTQVFLSGLKQTDFKSASGRFTVEPAIALMS